MFELPLAAHGGADDFDFGFGQRGIGRGGDHQRAPLDARPEHNRLGSHAGGQVLGRDGDRAVEIARPPDEDVQPLAAAAIDDVAAQAVLVPGLTDQCEVVGLLGQL